MVIGTFGFWTMASFSSSQLKNKEVQSAIQQAEEAYKNGNIAHAVALMDTLLQKFPQNIEVLVHFGKYAMLMAGQVSNTNLFEAGQWANRSYSLLNQACALDSSYVLARFYRGVLGANAPEFLGWLDQGIRDLEYVETQFQRKALPPEKISPLELYYHLATAYRKKKAVSQLKNALEQLVRYAPDSEFGKNAKEELTRMETPSTQAMRSLPASNEVQQWIEKGKALMAQNRIREGLEAYREAIKGDSTNLALLLSIADLVRDKASQGYGHFIYEDQTARSLLAFEMVRIFDQAVRLAPQNPEVRLWRGLIHVMMPFFVNKLEQGIEDLTWVYEHASSDSLKAEALYWLGFAYRQKSLSYWNKVAMEYQNTQAFQRLLNAMAPPVVRVDVDTLQKPVLVVEFDLGFQDVMAPQTAVWIEDHRGRHVKTLYVSGFSGFVKEKQVVLLDWAQQSQFEGAEAVTGASIDVGHYCFAWNCTDTNGKKVKPGRYTVQIEVSYWPSMQYEHVMVPIDLGEKNAKSISKGKRIPFVKVQYFFQ